MTGCPSPERLLNELLLMLSGALNETMPFSFTNRLVTGPLPKSIGNPSAMAPLDASFTSVNGHDSGPLEPGVHAVPSPVLLVPKSSPSPPEPNTGPKSTETCLARTGALRQSAQSAAIKPRNNETRMFDSLRRC